MTVKRKSDREYNKARAQLRRPLLVTKERRCLKCQTSFQSSVERICPRCTVRNSEVLEEIYTTRRGQ